MNLIDKDAVVAVIERMMAEEMAIFEESLKDGSHEVSAAPVAYTRLQMLLSAVNAIEVKEVNLEKEIDRFYGMYRKDGKTFLLKDNKECVDWKIDCNPEFEKSFAKHFFELGMAVSNKAQKGEKV